MGERTKYTHGTFSWADVTTPDQEGAKQFYSELFGWSTTDFPVGGGSVYTMADLGGKPVAAVSPQQQAQRDAGVPPAWNSYISVRSADDAVARAKELGASVHAEPFDVMDAGRMAVIQDPQGAFFMIWEVKDHNGAGLVNGHGLLTWNELATSDVEASARFYGDLFGWSFESVDAAGMPYLMIKNSDGWSNGGIRPVMPPGAPTCWNVYFGTDDLDATTSMASTLGGAIIAEPMDIGMGQISVVSDPQGAVFALFHGEFDD